MIHSSLNPGGRWVAIEKKPKIKSAMELRLLAKNIRRVK